MDHLPRIAVADLGTNTFNLIIAEKLPQGGFSVLWEETKESRLGRKGGLEGKLSEEALQDALSLMKHYHAAANRFDVSKKIAVGTSALRQASNATIFQQKLESETDFQLSIVSGEEEARLIHQGILASGCLEIRRLVLDIGGGSCEFILAEKEQICWKKSFEIGMVRAANLNLKDADFQSGKTASLKTYFSSALKEVQAAIQEFRPKDLIGAAGSFDTLVALETSLRQQSFNSTYPQFQLNRDCLTQLRNKIILDSPEQRLQYPGIIPVRAPLLPYALTLIEETLAYFPQEAQLICTSYALREGVAKLVFENKWH